MPTRNVNLPDNQAKFIDGRVRSGRYQNASEVVRAGLRLLEQREKEDELKLRALRTLTADAFAALDRGEAKTFSPAELDQWLARPAKKPDRRTRGR
jgi:antitoxin ParD1/3/4